MATVGEFRLEAIGKALVVRGGVTARRSSYLVRGSSVAGAEYISQYLLHSFVFKF